MLNSLHIKNYRNLKDFKIDSLNQVNLITGKNNTGKSTILESIAIYASRADMNLITELLEKRGENYAKSDSANIADINLKSLASLFTNREIGFNEENIIVIGDSENKTANFTYDNSIKLRFVRFIPNSNGVPTSRKYLTDEDIRKLDSTTYEVGFEVFGLETRNFRPLTKNINSSTLLLQNKKDNFQFLNTSQIDRDTNGKLFDNIALSDKEVYVIEALKIIEPSTERIAFIEEKPGERKAVIKLNGNKQTLPLRSMGDGINRILTIILALVNASDGYLLIDEFENGLHYTVQEKIWKIIFKLAKELNIQVFATTHSNDCIFGFEKALNDSENDTTGKLIRLDNENGTIKEVEFTAEELKIAERQNIEIR